MKNTTVCFTRVRSLFVCSSGRTSSMEAPVVPTKDARSPPSARKPVLVAGVATRSPRSRMPPETTNSPASSTMKET